MPIFVIVQSQRHLLEVIGALNAPRRLTGRLHGGEQERDENADDGDDHQKLDERKSGKPKAESRALGFSPTKTG